LFSYFLGEYRGGGDYAFHFEKANQGCDLTDVACKSYAPLFHWIVGPFAAHDNSFFYFVVFLLAFVVPMLLFLITKDWIVTWFYFSTTSFFYFFIDGIFAQATAMILLLLLIYFKDWRIQSLIVILGMIAHGHGFFLLSIVFVIINFFKLLDEENWLKITPACSGAFGNNRPEFLAQPIDGLTTTGVQFTVADALIPFTKVFPFPYFVLSVWYSWKNKVNLDLVVISFVAILAGFLVSHRIFYIIPLVLLPGLVLFYRSLIGWPRLLFLFSTLIVFVFQLYSWINFKLVCA
jgi:hypothetical protein|tara:strand:+ start:14715 stop:15587 length:873 start_codon:yes stop_codon:yes gene_type:complete